MKLAVRNHAGVLLDASLWLVLLCGLWLTVNELRLRPDPAQAGAVLVAYAMAFCVFFIFAAANWSLLKSARVPGLHAWWRGWSTWSLFPAVHVVRYGSGVESGLALAFQNATPWLSVVNSTFFLLAAMELGWPLNAKRNARIATAVFLVACTVTLGPVVFQRGSGVSRVTDNIMSFAVACVVGVAFGRRMMSEITEKQLRARRRVEAGIVLIVMAAFGVLQCLLGASEDHIRHNTALLIAVNISPALLGMALLRVMTGAGYRNLQEKTEGAEFLIDRELLVVGANRLAGEIVGLEVQGLQGRRMEEVLFRYRSDVLTMRDALVAGGRYGPRVVVCKRMSTIGQELREIRRVVSAEQIASEGVFATVRVGATEFPLDG